MRPYLAVIKDSFRAAMATWSLWALLIITTLILLSLLPLGYQEKRTMGLRSDEVFDVAILAELIIIDGMAEKKTPAGRVWELLDDQTHQQLLDIIKLLEEAEKLAAPAQEGEDDTPEGSGEAPEREPDAAQFQQRRVAMVATLRQFPRDLHEVILLEDFYKKQYWEGVKLRDEAQELLEVGQLALNDDEVGRLNRLLLESAFPDHIRTSQPRSWVATYASNPLGQPKPVKLEEFQEGVQGWIVWLVKWGYGALGMFIAILVTAPIIPQMLEPGSINLLLSKPVSRWALFLAKFVGGCAFIAISTTYFIVGLFLILGFRLGIWDAKLLFYIPMFMFVFAIYYAVSVLAASMSRSTVLAVVASIMFFLFCWGLGSVQWMAGNLFAGRVKSIVQIENALFQIDELGGVRRWRESESEWRPTFLSRDEAEASRASTSPVAGPVFDAKSGQLISLQGQSFQGVVFNSEPLLSVSVSEEGWRRVYGAIAIPGTTGLFTEPDGSMIAFTEKLGIFRLVGDPAEMPQESDLQELVTSLTSEQEIGLKVGPYQHAGPPSMPTMNPPKAIAMSDLGVLAIYSRGTMTLLEADDSGIYQQIAQKKVGPDEDREVKIAFGGSVLAVVGLDGRLDIYDKQLNETISFAPEGNDRPRSVAVSRKGRSVAVLYQNRKLWLLDMETKKMKRPRVTGQGDISAVAFSGQRTMLVADRTQRITEYSLGPLVKKNSYSPKMGNFEKVYRYVVEPSYFICPKPGELDKTIHWLLTGEETKAFPLSGLMPGNRIDQNRDRLRPMAPVWSGLGFIVVMLALGCLYIERQEF